MDLKLTISDEDNQLKRARKKLADSRKSERTKKRKKGEKAKITERKDSQAVTELVFTRLSILASVMQSQVGMFRLICLDIHI